MGFNFPADCSRSMTSGLFQEKLLKWLPKIHVKQTTTTPPPRKERKQGRIVPNSPVNRDSTWGCVCVCMCKGGGWGYNVYFLCIKLGLEHDCPLPSWIHPWIRQIHEPNHIGNLSFLVYFIKIQDLWPELHIIGGEFDQEQVSSQPKCSWLPTFSSLVFCKT